MDLVSKLLLYVIRVSLMLMCCFTMQDCGYSFDTWQFWAVLLSLAFTAGVSVIEGMHMDEEGDYGK